MTHTRRIRGVALASLAAGLITCAALTGTAAAARSVPNAAAPLGAPAAQRGLLSFPASRPLAAPPGDVAPLWRLPAHARPGRYPGQHTAPDGLGEPGGYDPATLRAYLGLHGTGAGQTVAVIEAYNINDDHAVSTAVNAYDRWYGLRPACSARVTTGCFHLTFAAPHGTCNTADCLYFGAGPWQFEAELDLELIHALAPRASIVAVEGYSQSNKSMMAALDYAQTLHPAVVSNSWGENEFSGQRALDSHCPAAKAPCVFSSGDSGNFASCLAENGSGAWCGGYPAADPHVLAVGGTTLDLSAAGKVVSETAWSGSGGGISSREPRPAYQRVAGPYTSGRGLPDVSFDADPRSGIATYLWDKITLPNGTVIEGTPGWFELGGTSVGAPAWAGILANVAQLRAKAGRPPLTIGQLHTAMYAKTRRKPIGDITTGSNGICGRRCSAGSGYDLVTGEGSPRPGIDAYLASR